MVMGYANKYFLELMGWLYIRYVQKRPKELMINQDEIQVTYNFKDPIEILFDQLEMGQKHANAVNLTFSYQKMAYTSAAKIFATQEYTHAY